MTATDDAPASGIGTARAIAAALRCPFVPAPLVALAAAGGYLDAVWPQLAPSVETAGFLGSALYMADMALDGAEAVYEPLLDRDALRAGGLAAEELARLEATLDVFHWVQPQLLLLLAALAEAWEQPQVGGQGRAEPRVTAERERAHLATPVALMDAAAPPLPAIAAALDVELAPDLYRAMAVWPRYLVSAWDELQHLVAYPDFRRRGRALYFYARSSARHLAQPLAASREALAARGIDAGDLATAERALDGALPSLAMMLMHCSAMRVALGLTEREVVRPS